MYFTKKRMIHHQFQRPARHMARTMTLIWCVLLGRTRASSHQPMRHIQAGGRPVQKSIALADWRRKLQHDQHVLRERDDNGRLAFLHEFKEVRDFMRRLSSQHTKAIATAERVLQHALYKHPPNRTPVYNMSLSFRTKTVSSTLSKMQRLGCDVEEILDIIGLRILITPTCTTDQLQDPCHLENVTEETMCHDVLDTVHNMWEPMPQTTRDYIAHPKPNGYRSLHTTIKVGVQPLEVQIRTVAMHDYNENGPAAHSMYKQMQHMHYRLHGAGTLHDTRQAEESKQCDQGAHKQPMS